MMAASRTGSMDITLHALAEQPGESVEYDLTPSEVGDVAHALWGRRVGFLTEDETIETLNKMGRGKASQKPGLTDFVDNHYKQSKPLNEKIQHC